MVCPEVYPVIILLQLSFLLELVVRVLSVCCKNMLYACYFFPPKERNQLINFLSSTLSFTLFETQNADVKALWVTESKTIIA